MSRTMRYLLCVTAALLAVLHLVSIGGWDKEVLELLRISHDTTESMVYSTPRSAESTSNNNTMHINSPNNHKLIETNTQEEEGKYDDGEDNPSQFRILMLHYHKTGFVLSRDLRTHAVKYLMNQTQQPMFHIPKKNWGSIQQPRKFDESTNCPGVFHLEGGVINVQESPDYYCSIEELARILFNETELEITRGTRIIHFVRNPYSMALSNYFYHAQDPTPEPWVRRHHPCELEYVDSNVTLKDVLFPTLSVSKIMTKENFDELAKVCRSLYRAKPKMENEVFEGHLHQLDPLDGLRLSTTQMMIRGGGKVLMPGGDLLRMANTIIKLHQLQSYLRSKREYRNNPFTLVTVSMDDFISDPAKFTETYLDFLLGVDHTQLTCPGKNCANKIILKKLGKSFELGYQKMNDKGSSHVTTGRHSNKDELKDILKKDPLFGPILDRIEELVDEALMRR